MISLQNLAVNICNEKSDWIDHTPDATTQEFLTQKVHLDEALSAIWIKLSEPRKYMYNVDYFKCFSRRRANIDINTYQNE